MFILNAYEIDLNEIASNHIIYRTKRFISFYVFLDFWLLKIIIIFIRLWIQTLIKDQKIKIKETKTPDKFFAQ